MTDPFPHRYEADLVWEGRSQAAMTAPSCPTVVGGPPPQFGGDPGRWSPEHLLLSAANLCLMTTFFAMATRSELTVRSYRGHVEGTLDKTREGIRFTAIRLIVEIECAGDMRDRVEQTLHSAEKHCIISNALKVPVELDATVLAAR